MDKVIGLAAFFLCWGCSMHYAMATREVVWGIAGFFAGLWAGNFAEILWRDWPWRKEK